MHVMLDLETWGKKPGCDIRSIGACVFIPHTGAVCTLNHIQFDPNLPPGAFYTALENPDVTERHNEGEPIGYLTEPGSPPVYRKYRLIRDPETVQWWSEQNIEAQSAFVNPVDLRDGLMNFRSWLAQLCPPAELRLWSHGPAFDIAILAAAYDALAIPVPWHYRAPRDTRTAFDLARVGDHSEWLQRFNTGTWHHALDDAISQAKAVSAALQRISTP